MQIPQYWAQVRLRHEIRARNSVTVQRWGWSDISQHHAQEHAQKRAEQALDAAINAPKETLEYYRFPRMEWRGEYGLDGATPIREQVLERRGNTVKTRNSYGAHCLNVEDVGIADVDYPNAAKHVGPPWFASLMLIAALIYISTQPAVWNMRMWGFILVTAMLGWYCLHHMQQWIKSRAARAQAIPPQQVALADIEQFSAQHPDWGLRVYQTPKGLRVIVTHMPMTSSAPEVRTLFDGLKVDPLYSLLCDKQQCFRARVTGKPWRMGMSGLSSMDRRWPVDPANASSRQQWSTEYDREAEKYAACHHLTHLGNPSVCAEAQEFIRWHDATSKAQSSLPLA